MDGWIFALNAARDFDQLCRTTLTHARRIAGADAATFVLREGALCRYVAEDSDIALWAGRRVAIRDCIGGWAMRRGEVVEVADIDTDERFAHVTYRPPLVRSLTMVPMGAGAPVGAIGVCWARPGRRVPPGSRVELERLARAAGNRVALLVGGPDPGAPALLTAC